MQIHSVSSHIAQRKRQGLLLGVLALLLACMLLLGTSLGSGTFRLPLGLSDHELALFLRLRLPRVLMGALVGAGLAMSGALSQAVLRNPLASPFTLGISSGAAFGAALAIMVRHGLTVAYGRQCLCLCRIDGSWCSGAGSTA